MVSSSGSLVITKLKVFKKMTILLLFYILQMLCIALNKSCVFYPDILLVLVPHHGCVQPTCYYWFRDLRNMAFSQQCWCVFKSTTCMKLKCPAVVYRSADKSLAQPGRKQATFPAFYGTWSPPPVPTLAKSIHQSHF